jgi:hypothetical protein
MPCLRSPTRLNADSDYIVKCEQYVKFGFQIRNGIFNKNKNKNRE